MSQNEEGLSPQGQQEFEDRAQGIIEEVTDSTIDIPGRLRSKLFGWTSKNSSLTKLEPKKLGAQIYGLKAETIFTKFCVTPLDLDDPDYINGLVNAENIAKQKLYMSGYPNPFLIMVTKQHLVRESSNQNPTPPAPAKKGWSIFGK